LNEKITAANIVQKFIERTPKIW